jgi:hypothetical protein
VAGKKAKRTARSPKQAFQGNPRSPEQHTSADVWYRHGGKFIAVAGTVILGGIAMIKARPEDIPVLVKSIFETDVFQWTGWIVAAVSILFSVVMVALHRNCRKEIARLAQERSDLQSILIGRRVPHSGQGG